MIHTIFPIYFCYNSITKIDFSLFNKFLMKKYIVCIILFASLTGSLNAQGFHIAVKTPDLSVDSLHIYAYNPNKKQFRPVYAVKYKTEVIFADSKFLNPGLYLINADTNTVIEFLISDNNHQQFSIDIQYDTVIYHGSDENTANFQYQQSMRKYNQQIAWLNNQYQQIQQGDKSLIEKQMQIDSIILQSEEINRQKAAYQARVAEENKGSLLASIILSVMEVLPPPAEYYKDKTLYYKYLAEHCFDKYDFSDDRILATPLANSKFQSFSAVIAELGAEDAIPYVLDALRKSQVSPQQNSDLFDYIEHDFGTVKSPFRKEMLYIAILKYAINYSFIDTYKKERYLYELNMIDKNHAGDKLPNFNLILNNGDTTNLYAIKAERLLLYFHNPDCPSCKKIREKMKEMEAALSNKKITILTIYFENDKNLWQSYLQKNAYPKWLHGWNYDLSIEEKKLVDVRGIPSLYLLDANKTILKKDLKMYELEGILSEP